jgi:hypothetical protein
MFQPLHQLRRRTVKELHPGPQIPKSPYSDWTADISDPHHVDTAQPDLVFKHEYKRFSSTFRESTGCAEFVWRLDEMPWNGTIVAVAHGSQPLRWAYLPDGATRLEVENAFGQAYRWYKSLALQATK